MTPLTITEIESTLQRHYDEADSAGVKTYLDGLLANGAMAADLRGRVAHLRGRAAFHLGEWKEAEHYFLQAVSLSPADWFSMFYLGRIAEELGNADRALALYARCVADQPGMAHVADFMTTHLLRSPSGLAPIDARSIAFHPTQRTRVPLISIFILCYNKVEFTVRCLRALEQNTDYGNYEVILVDNASVDDTPPLLETYARRMTYVRAPQNLGFVGGNNLAALHASGEFIVFLNNDTEPQSGWLTELHQQFVRDARAGAAGSMLLYPNGMLQEAGGTVFSDATGWNYGRGQDPRIGKFTFVREVDYCSAAALMVRRDLFERLGRFDERFAPAYYEDTDLCFGIRKLGYKVIYCPTSKVIHHEGITAGTNTGSGFKQYQVVNARTFADKWTCELERQHSSKTGSPYLFSNRSNGKRVLIIDDIPPLPDRASGSLKMYHTVLQMVQLGYHVTYVHLRKGNFDETAVKHIDRLKGMGVEFQWFEYELWWIYRQTPEVVPLLDRLINSMEFAKRHLDLVYICFWQFGEYFIDRIRTAIPHVPIVVDSVDLHYIREARQAEISGDAAQRAAALETKRRELAVYRSADIVTTVTDRDREILRGELPGKPILIMTNVHDIEQRKNGFEERKDLLFVGNFNHGPNEDAVLWFVHEVFPAIQKELPDVRLHIVGNNPTVRVQALAGEKVIVTGWVPSVAPYLETSRLSVAPLRFGSGVKGKVGEAMAKGLPMVLTPVAAEGMGIVHDQHAYVCDAPKDFARMAVDLYRSKETWERFSEAGAQLIAKQYSSASTKRRIEYLATFESRETCNSRRATQFGTPPVVSIVIPVFNQWEFTRQCLESIRAHTTVNHEVIVVDNASTDKTARGLREFPEVRVIRNGENVGFPGAVNQGMRVALGEYVLILNNDTIVTEGWLSRMLEVAESKAQTGIIGPVSNAVSGIQIDKEAAYSDIPGMHRYAAQKRGERKGKLLEFPRVAFLCTLIKRSVLDAIGGLDERFAPGNYEDDDFCLRAQLAGFNTVVAADVFIHHFGSKSFRANGDQAYADRLQENRARFEAKWGNTPDGIWLKGASFKRRSIRVSNDKDDFIRHFERATILLEGQELDLAAEELEAAIDAYHRSDRRGYAVDFPDVLTLAGNVALMQENLEVAKEYFERELRLTPTSVRACLGLVKVFRLAGMTDAAATMLEAARQIAPRDPAVAAESRELEGLLQTANEA